MNYSTIPPVFVRKLVDFIKSNKGDCFITDHYVYRRHPERRGYTESNPVALFWITAVTSASITILKKLISNPSNMLILQGLSMMLI